MNITRQVRDYWEKGSCGTDRTEKDQYSLDYFEEIEEFRYKHEPFIHSFVQFTRWQGKRILEVGVGAGTDFLQFVRAGAIACGVDLTAEAIRNVQKRLVLYGLKAEDLRTCNAVTLPYDAEVFDLVYSWGVIHHAENMEQVFAEIYRVARIGGHVKIMVYNLRSLYAWYKFLQYGLPQGKFLGGRQWAIYHFQESYATKAYSEREIRSLLTNFPHKDLRFYYWDQLVREGARFEYIRRVLQKVTPPAHRWYLAFEFVKTEA
jgi:ubiquinone/menaquinone biosynthesis C-methylase UbiE